MNQNTITPTRVPLYLMLAIIALPQLSETIYSPALPRIAAALGTSANWVEHTMTIYLMGFACGVLWWGTHSDRRGRKPGLYWGWGIYALASLGCFFSTHISMLMLMRFIQAFGASTGSVLGLAIARDSSTAAERGKLFSSISMGMAFAPALGPVIGNMVEGMFGWSYIFVTLTLFACMLLWLIWSQLPETHTELHHDARFSTLVRRCLNRMLHDREILMNGVLIGGVNGILFGYFAEAGFYFKHMLQVTPTFFVMMSFYAFIPLVSGSILSRILHEYRVQSVVIVRLGIALVMTSASCFYGAAHLLGPDAQTALLWTSIAGVAGILLGIRLVIPNVLGHALENYKEYAGTAASLFGFYYYVLIALFTGLMAVLHNGTVMRLPLFFVLVGSCLVLAYWYGGFSKKQAVQLM